MAGPAGIFVQLGRYVMDVNMFPVIFICHFVIICFFIREDSKDLGPRWHQNHPFASWLSTLLASLAGVFVVNFIFGNPLIDIMKDEVLVLMLTVIWYLMNYCPFDLLYKVARVPAVLMSMAVLQESLRLRVIYLGLQQAAKAYPGANFIIIIGGALNGNGFGYMKVIQGLVRGKWTPEKSDLLQVTFVAKSALYASVVLMLQKWGYLPLPEELVYLAVLGVFVVCRLISTVTPIKDPLLPLETPIYHLLFGVGDSADGETTTGKSSVNGKEEDKKKN